MSEFYDVEADSRNQYHIVFLCIPSILVTFFSQYISLLRLDNTAIPGSY